MKLHTPAHKHVGDVGKPGQIVNRIDENPTAVYVLHGTATGRFTSTTSNIEEVQRGRVTAEDVSKSQAGIGHMFRDLMRKQGMQVDMGLGLKLADELQAKTLKDTL